MREETVGIGALTLESGQSLRAVEQRVTIYGTPNGDRSNVVLIAHALTGSSRAAEWWPGISGDGALFDLRRWCIVCVNALGSCYGSTGPASVAPDGGPYGDRFPRVTVGDIVRAQEAALERLGFDDFAFVIGGSLGGMQALQWALAAPRRVRSAIVVGAHDGLRAMSVALCALQREALALDPVRGLRLARKIAMLTYKSDELLELRHGRLADRNGGDRFDVEGYLELHADRLAARMDARSYGVLTDAMSAFDVRDAGTNGDATRRPALTFVGIESDWLFRAKDVRETAERFAARGFDARYLHLDSAHGHDAFLAETAALRALLDPLVAECTAC